MKTSQPCQRRGGVLCDQPKNNFDKHTDKKTNVTNKQTNRQKKHADKQTENRTKVTYKQMNK